MTYVPSDLRRLTLKRSNACCEYCRLPESGGTVTFHIEHIIAVSHGGPTTENNLAYSCSMCNHHKGPNIAAVDPQSGEPTFLYHPRRHDWDEHFALNEAVIEPLTPEGRATAFVLHFNDLPRVEQREVLIQLGTYPCKQE